MWATCSPQARSSPGSIPRSSRMRCARRRPISRRSEAVLTQARLTFSRQQELLKDGWTTRANFDEAQQKLLTAQAQVDSAQAQVRIAREQQSYTVLSADAPGAVTAVGAEPGEVVHAGQMVVQLAREGGRDAVFDVPEQLIRNGPRDPVVEIALSNDPQVKATGRVREIAPQADSATRTFQVKVGITDPPEAMRLGATVIGRIRLSAPARRRGPCERAHRDGRAPGRVGGRSAEPDRVPAQRRGRCVTTRPRRDLAEGWRQARSWSPPACRRCAPARRSASWEPPHEPLQPHRMGDPASFARDLFHARHRGGGNRIVPPSRAQRGSGLHRQDHGRAGRVAGRHGQRHAPADHRPPRAQARRRRRTSTT